MYKPELKPQLKCTLLSVTLVAASCLGIASTASAATSAEFVKTSLKLDLGSSYLFQESSDLNRANPRQTNPFTIGSARRGGISRQAAQAPGVDHTRNRRTEILRFNFN